MSDFVIVSNQINENFEKELRNCGLDVIRIDENKNLYTAINTHADIIVCKIDDQIVLEKQAYYKYRDILSNRGYRLIVASEIVNDKYPHDVKLNLAYTGEFAIHNFKYTDKVLLDILNKKNIKKLNIKQGYSKCSILIVDDKSIITSDSGIYESLKYDLNCLLIKKGSILLNSLEYGFIGGATGRYKDEIWFYGDISKHPDYQNIKEFIEDRNLKLKYFKDFELEDIGSILFFSI